MIQRLAAILAADVVGYAKLMEADERATVTALIAGRTVFREYVAAHGGVMISEDVHRQVAGKGTRDFADAGVHAVKNIANPVRAFGLASGIDEPASRPGPTLPDKPSIAVLPFDNRSSDPEQE